MRCTNMTGYLFDKEIRALPVFSAISLTVGGLSCCALWYLVFFRENSFEFLAIIAGVWSFFWIMLTRYAIQSKHFVTTVYNCNGTAITLNSAKETYFFDLRNPFFLTSIPFRFYYGKGYSEQLFLVISPKRIDQLTNDFVGSEPIVRICRNGGVVLPKEASIWLTEATGTNHISQYPRSMYFPGLKRPQTDSNEQ